MEHDLKILFGTVPGSDGIAEEDEVLDYTSWVDADHRGDAPER